jgi:alkylation response protein AidB-like acyl-CoA dehydrogenase
MGRLGLFRGSVIERLYREARPMRIYEGATEVILDALARQLVKRYPGGSSQLSSMRSAIYGMTT